MLLFTNEDNAPAKLEFTLASSDPPLQRAAAVEQALARGAQLLSLEQADSTNTDHTKGSITKPQTGDEHSCAQLPPVADMSQGRSDGDGVYVAAPARAKISLSETSDAGGGTLAPIMAGQSKGPGLTLPAMQSSRSRSYLSDVKWHRRVQRWHLERVQWLVEAERASKIRVLQEELVRLRLEARESEPAGLYFTRE